MVQDKDGKCANATLKIGIQCNDILEEGEAGAMICLHPNTIRGRLMNVEVGPNIGPPNIETRADITRAVGLIEYHIEFSWETSAGDYEWIVIHSEFATGHGNDLHFSYDVSPSEIPDEVLIYKSKVEVTVMCWEGGWENSYISINVVYSMEKLN
jgi:hypothetical protein